jgi:uncharacterized protein
LKPSLVDFLECPAGCDSSLSLREDLRDGPEILEGALTCRECGVTYPIEEGIPRMLPASLSPAGDPEITPQADPEAVEAVRRKRSEMEARDAQVEEYDQMWHLNLFGLLEVPATLLNLGLGSDHLLLEGGCGTGRMTREFASRCREQVSIDFSWESLRVCAAKLRRSGTQNVHLAQADLCALPFRSDLFDRVVSCQVLEHIPTPSARDAAVSELGRVLRPDGNLVLSAYQYSLLMRLFGEKEGEHAGGIYFYRFTREELEELLSRHLNVSGITGALVYHYIARCGKA